MADVDVAENKNVLFQQYEIKLRIYDDKICKKISKFFYIIEYFYRQNFFLSLCIGSDKVKTYIILLIYS